ncbi:hypothetical protein [Streptomyces manipurensis]|uniref:hypothetical protein n=1 Tax=Streptomyces manipurensis TaxID=1077945 RepID=UPI003C703CDD
MGTGRGYDAHLERTLPAVALPAGLPVSRTQPPLFPPRRHCEPVRRARRPEAAPALNLNPYAAPAGPRPPPP